MLRYSEHSGLKVLIFDLGLKITEPSVYEPELRLRSVNSCTEVIFTENTYLSMACGSSSVMRHCSDKEHA